MLECRVEVIQEYSPSMSDGTVREDASYEVSTVARSASEIKGFK